MSQAPVVSTECAGPSPLERRFAVSADGDRLAYVEAGSGPSLVLIHGTLVTLEDMWLGPMAALSRHFRVIAFDRPGHGESDRDRRSEAASIWRQAEILRSAAATLGCERPLLVGHSFGGAVALAWAMGWPEEVEAVVALAPVCFPEPRLEQLVFGPRAVPVWGDMLAEGLHATSDRLLLPALWRAMFLPQSMPDRFAAEFPFALAGRSAQTIREGEDAAALWPDLARSAAAYGSCRVPVRFLCGGADLVVNNLLHGRLAAQLIPDADFRWIPGAGHMLHHFHVDDIAATALSLSGRA